jgi:phosphomannomutase
MKKDPSLSASALAAWTRPERTPAVKDERLLESPDLGRALLELAPLERRRFAANLIRRAESQVVPGGFRSYDIRIRADRLTNPVVFYIALKAAPLLRGFARVESGPFRIAVGSAAERARPSSSRIKRCYLNGLLLSGAEVIDLGVTTTPDVYFAAAYLKSEGIRAVVNISASHNPRQDNGIKHCIVTPDYFIHSISAKQMDRLKKHVLGVSPARKRSDREWTARLEKLETLPPIGRFSSDPDALCRLHHAFVVACGILGERALTLLNKRHDGDFRRVLETLLRGRGKKNPVSRVAGLAATPWPKLQRAIGLPASCPAPSYYGKQPFSDFVIVLDYGRGTGYRTPEIYRALGAKVIEVDRERGFNPLESKNQDTLRTALKTAVRANPGKEVVGFAHDEDSDRLSVMRPDGTVVPGDRLLAICCLNHEIENADLRRPVVITEVKSRPASRIFLKRLGIRVLVVPTGFAFIKDAAIRLEKALSARRNGKGPAGGQVTLYGNRVRLDRVRPACMWAELSGHFGLAQELSYFFDDASLMAVHLLVCLLEALQDGVPPGNALLSLDRRIPRECGSGEINLFLKTRDPGYVPTSGEKEALVAEFARAFRNHPGVSTIDKTDGIQVFFKNPQGGYGGWLLIRKSNNEDKLVVLTAAPDSAQLDAIETGFFRIARKASTSLIEGVVLTDRDAQPPERLPDSYVTRRLEKLGLD